MVATISHPKARTVALVGAVGSGKSSLLDSLVRLTWSTDQPLSVPEGATWRDVDPEERHHGTSLGITIAPIWVGADKLTLLDTPGSVDFLCETQRALDVADVAVLVVNAAAEVGIDTEMIWRQLRRADIPTVVFLNNLDAEHANFAATLTALEALIGPIAAPLELPIGSGASFIGVVDLIADEALIFDGSVARHGPVPGELAELEALIRASLIEAIVVGDDTLTERYLDGEVPSMDELEPVLGQLMSSGRIVPVTCGSVGTAVGVERLATLLDEIATSRLVAATDGGHKVQLVRDPEGEPVLRAFKVVIDPYLGRIVVMEVISGTVTTDLVLTNGRTKTDERLHGLNFYFGSKLVPVDRALAGDVVAVAKLTSVQVGDVLTTKGRDLVIDPAETPPPAMSVAVTGVTRSDDDKIVAALHRLAEEDPALRVRHDPVSHSLVVDAMGDLHLQVTTERLRRRFNVDVALSRPSVELFETITRPCEVEGRLKKQTGGHGQFAVVNVKVEPLAPNEAFEFVDAVVGGAVPRHFVGAVRKGVERAMAHGGPLGFPVIGLRVTLCDGKFHSVDSSEAAFETAGSLALRSALEQSGTTALENIMALRTTVPIGCLGDVLNDLATRRGRVIGTDQSDDDMVVVSAHVPEGELYRYRLDLRSLTGGRGSAEIEHHDFAEAPKSVLAH